MLVICTRTLLHWYLEIRADFNMSAGSCHITQPHSCVWEACMKFQRSQWWVWVCECGLDCWTTGWYVIPKWLISLNIHTVAESPWDPWPLSLTAFIPPSLSLSLSFSRWGRYWAGEQLCWPWLNYSYKVHSSWHPGCGWENQGLSKTPCWEEKGTTRRIDNQPLQSLSSWISLSHFKDKWVCVCEMCHKGYSNRWSCYMLSLGGNQNESV